MLRIVKIGATSLSITSKSKSQRHDVVSVPAPRMNELKTDSKKTGWVRREDVPTDGTSAFVPDSGHHRTEATLQVKIIRGRYFCGWCDDYARRMHRLFSLSSPETGEVKPCQDDVRSKALILRL